MNPSKSSGWTAAGAWSANTLPQQAPLAARWTWRLLQRLRHGTLELQLPDGSTARFGHGDQPRAAIRLRNWKVCAKVLQTGDIGFAQSYMDGDWSTQDLATLIRLFLLNREQVQAVIHGSWWASSWYRVRHWLNRNSRTGSRKNIHAHYDLGNEFYRLWLDPTLNYSSAWFAGRSDADMAQAQHAKMCRALDEVGAQAGSKILEIGCGWGALAEVAATRYRARVLGVTLSQEQLNHGHERLRAPRDAGLVELRLQDYREIPERDFDGIVSIEMFEAVGRAYWDQYFQAIKRCLKPGGRACIQSITIRDDLFEHYSRSTDFIQQYIFPGGFLPSDAALREAVERNGLKVVNDLAFGQDYAQTLRYWRDRFLHKTSQVLRLGFDERFIRLWEFYLSYCEAAFETGSTNVVQYTLAHA